MEITCVCYAYYGVFEITEASSTAASRADYGDKSAESGNSRTAY